VVGVGKTRLEPSRTKERGHFAAMPAQSACCKRALWVSCEAQGGAQPEPDGEQKRGSMPSFC
jgi:hypothetical protein